MSLTPSPDSPREPAPARSRVALGLAVAVVLAHLVLDAGYGIFRDELYYLACARRLAWGYVDHPPLSIALLALQRLLLPDTPWALRLLPALAHGMTVWLGADIARRLGGAQLAQTLTATAILAAPVYVALGHYYSMNAFDVLAWTMAVALLTRWLASDDVRVWPWLGVVLGLGLLNKWSVLWLGAGLTVALLASPRRRVLATRGPWLTAGLALLLFLPNLLWQARHDWPTLEFMRNATGTKMADVSLAAFFGGQLGALHPWAAPLWFAGLLALLLAPRLRAFRPLLWVYLTTLAILLWNGKSRANYLAPAYPVLFAAGAVLCETWARRAQARAWRVRLAWGYVGLLLLGGMLAAPLAAPLLPVATYVRYAAALGEQPRTEERKAIGILPQHFADRFGWPELAAAAAEAYRGLPADEQARAVLFTTNYGRAGALELYGAPLGLPPVACGHNNYWLWQPALPRDAVVLLVGGDEDDHRRAFESIQLIARRSCHYCMPYEADVPIYVGRGLRLPAEQVWTRVKNFS
jgi:4-amino-4-deoxy-L-arabinose transferase-like glycosyltransferase